MSKFVCNVRKFKGNQLYGMDIHIQRKTDNHTNEDIDISRSNLNYDFVENAQNGHYYTLAKNRIEQGYTGKKKIRKDGVWTGSVIISSDNKFFKSLSEEEEKRYFETCYEYLCERYGKENVISAKVHKDETTPHMHVLIVPLTNDGRLCGKELFDRNAFRDMQEQMPRRLQKIGFNIERGEKNAKTKRIETEEWKKLRRDNQVSLTIDPTDVKQKIISEKLFSKELESHEKVAERLQQKYIKPLTEELSDLKTDIALKERIVNKIEYSRKAQKINSDPFVELYDKAREFGVAHVQDVLEKVTALVEKMNSEKQQQSEEKEQAKLQARAEKQLRDKIELYGGANGLYQVLDFGSAPYQFQENGEKSYYVAVESMTDHKKSIHWGEYLRDLRLKIGDFVRFSNGVMVNARETVKNALKSHSGGFKMN